MVTSIILTIIGSGGFFTFLQFLINRHDGRKEQLSQIREDICGIQEKLAALDSRNELQDARTSRTRILRFDDEIVEGRKHSREYFLQILDDVEIYEKWAAANPQVKNGYAKAAAKHIKETYEDLLRKGEWKQ